MQKESITPAVLRDYLLTSEINGPTPQVFSKVYPHSQSAAAKNRTSSSAKKPSQFSVKFKHYQSRQRKTVLGLSILLVVLVLALLGFIGYQFFELNYAPLIRYRTNRNLSHDFSSDDESGLSEWHDCPPHAFCQNGVIVECGQDHELFKNECINKFSTNERNFKLEKLMRIKLAEILAERKGNQICSYAATETSQVNLDQLNELLREHFSQEPHYSDALHQLNDIFRYGLEDFPESIEVTEIFDSQAGRQLFLESKVIKRGLWCSFLTVLEKNPVVLSIFTLLITISLYQLISKLKQNKVEFFSENLYKCLLLLLQTEKEVKLDTLITFLPPQAFKDLRADILEDLEHIVDFDKQVIIQKDANGWIYFLQA